MSFAASITSRAATLDELERTGVGDDANLHDGALAILRDGELIAITNEYGTAAYCDERFDRETVEALAEKHADLYAGRPGKDGAGQILDERISQRAGGYTASHDDEHDKAEIASAAIAYAIFAWWQITVARRITGWTRDQVDEIVLEQWWPWDALEWKPADSPIRNLAKAGALCAAEIDRLIRGKR